MLEGNSPKIIEWVSKEMDVRRERIWGHPKKPHKRTGLSCRITALLRAGKARRLTEGKALC
jgi:hypothetical protein